MRCESTAGPSIAVVRVAAIGELGFGLCLPLGPALRFAFAASRASLSPSFFSFLLGAESKTTGGARGSHRATGLRLFLTSQIRLKALSIVAINIMAISTRIILPLIVSCDAFVEKSDIYSCIDQPI